MTHPLKCSCGAVRGSVETGHPTGHSLCYCKDCQAFARFLGREAEILDARGGCENIQTVPKYVRFETGAEHLACMRLTGKGLLRWYCACCNTPIGNTLPTCKLPFIALARPCIEAADPTVEQSFGPVRSSLFTRGARGEPKPKPFGAARTIFWILGNTTRRRFMRDFSPNPFFDTDADRPIVQPTILPTAERARLREG
ncbi:MAG TPA: DUF6151 family protein [Caulobacteraceae bacterium]|nr:DUF6151 family protein [Caulobacteraceae bacterium]